MTININTKKIDRLVEILDIGHITNMFTWSSGGKCRSLSVGVK